MAHDNKSTKAPQSRIENSGSELAAEALPFARAFIVQFVEPSGPSTPKFEGRVEHLESGRRARFGSRKALLGVLVAMLLQTSACPNEDERPRK